MNTLEVIVSRPIPSGSECDRWGQRSNRFGRQGIGSPEMVKRLEMAVRIAMHFLDESRENVVQLYKG